MSVPINEAWRRHAQRGRQLPLLPPWRRDAHPGCDLQRNALQLDNPTVIVTAVANENGVASITRSVPLVARGQTILFQAVVPGECAISQLVVWRFE